MTKVKILEYIEQWRHGDYATDLNLMLDRQLIAMACSIMASSGALEEGTKMTKAIETLAEDKEAYIEESEDFFKSIEVWVDETNLHQFIPTDYYIGIEKDHLTQDGFKFVSGYDKKGSLYTESQME